MIYAYGITEQGTYHIKHNIVCQDAHKIIKCRDDLVIAAVADGLGSEEHSDVASKIAVEISTGHCVNNIEKLTEKNSILEILKTCFSLAQNSIEQEALARGHAVDQYDTTLTLALMFNGTLYYGHSGDSGIIALTKDGLYEKVTEQQRDEDNRVFPLFFRDKWIFEHFNKEVCSVFLATDGIFDILFPVYIRNEPVNIHIALARFFMDNRSLHIDELGEDKITAQMNKFILNIPDAQVNDDKTVVVLVNASVEPALQPDEYYKEPDWAELKHKKDEEWKRMAYPNLFKDITNVSNEIPKAENEQDDITTNTILKGGENATSEKRNKKRAPKKKNIFKRIFKR
jgi:serine/threonine protein phosphatase PrpC